MELPKNIESFKPDIENLKSAWDSILESKINEIDSLINSDKYDKKGLDTLISWKNDLETLKTQKDSFKWNILETTKEGNDKLKEEIEVQEVLKEYGEDIKDELSRRMLGVDESTSLNMDQKMMLNSYFNNYFTKELIENYDWNQEELFIAIEDFCDDYTDVLTYLKIPTNIDDLSVFLDEGDILDNLNNDWNVTNLESVRKYAVANNIVNVWLWGKNDLILEGNWVNTITSVANSSSLGTYSFNTQEKEGDNNKNISNENIDINTHKTIDNLLNTAKVSAEVLSKLSSDLSFNEETWELDLAKDIDFWWGKFIKLSDDGKNFELTWFGYNFAYDKKVESFAKILNKVDSLEFLENTWLYVLWTDTDTAFKLLSKFEQWLNFDIHKDEWLTGREKRKLLQIFNEMWIIGNYILTEPNKRICDSTNLAMYNMNQKSFFDDWKFHRDLFKEELHEHFYREKDKEEKV